MLHQAPDTLVISGGGADGISFVGALEVLERIGGLCKLRNIVGCSVGAILAVLVAIGMRSDEIVAWVMSGIGMGLTQLDRSGIFHITSTLGIDDGKRILDHIQGAMRQRMGPNHENPTIREFAQATGINITLVATNIHTAARELLSVDTAPDLPVLTAVRMSFAVPVLFTPVLWRNQLYVDGALIDCCPTAHIETSGDATNVVVLNIQVPVAAPAAGQADSGTSLMEYGSLICRLVMMRQHVIPCPLHRNNRPTILCTINIPTKVELTPFNIRTMHLELTQESVDALLAHGRRCAQAVIESAAGEHSFHPSDKPPPPR